MAGLISRFLKVFNYTLKRIDPFEGQYDISSDKEFLKIYEAVKEYTMTTPERLYSLYHSVEYVIKNNIPGDFVECGVWRGGSAMTIVLTLKEMGITDRKIWLYDTYEGMSEPTKNDNDIFGNTARTLLEKSPRKNMEKNVWCIASIEDVERNLYSTGYPRDNIRFIKGKVEDTIPASAPSVICLLRLDTDWYESTLHELHHFYPILSQGGILLIDDYGHWQGARKAVDEYIRDNRLSLFLHRVDYTARSAIKY